ISAAESVLPPYVFNVIIICSACASSASPNARVRYFTIAGSTSPLSAICTTAGPYAFRASLLSAKSVVGTKSIIAISRNKLTSLLITVVKFILSVVFIFFRLLSALLLYVCDNGLFHLLYHNE